MDNTDLIPNGPVTACQCRSLGDLAVVPMGGDDLDERVFATLERVCEHGQELWWLYLSRCLNCGQHWLVAQEERIYDEYFLKRLGPVAAEAVMVSGNWPDDIITYERVLALGRSLSTPPRFLDAFAYSLQCTVEDLRKERPAILPSDIAYLLGITHLHAWKLFWKVRLSGATKLPS